MGGLKLLPILSTPIAPIRSACTSSELGSSATLSTWQEGAGGEGAGGGAWVGAGGGERRTGMGGRGGGG